VIVKLPKNWQKWQNFNDKTSWKLIVDTRKIIALSTNKRENILVHELLPLTTQ
jgi:hypothetical protein